MKHEVGSNQHLRVLRASASDTSALRIHRHLSQKINATTRRLHSRCRSHTMTHGGSLRPPRSLRPLCEINRHLALIDIYRNDIPYYWEIAQSLRSHAMTYGGIFAYSAPPREINRHLALIDIYQKDIPDHWAIAQSLRSHAMTHGMSLRSLRPLCEISEMPPREINNIVQFTVK